MIMKDLKLIFALKDVQNQTLKQNLNGVNELKQKIIQHKGFKGCDDTEFFSINNGNGKVRDSVVRSVRRTFNKTNGFLKETKRQIDKVVIEKRISSTLRGNWYDYERTLTIFDIDDVPVKEIYETVIHELSHAWYNHKERTNSKAINKFARTVNNLLPITFYTSTKKDSWGFYLYANEIHSAVTTINAKTMKTDFGGKQNFIKVRKAYETLHKEASKKNDIREFSKSYDLTDKDLDKLWYLKLEMLLCYSEVDESIDFTKSSDLKKLKKQKFPPTLESQKALTQSMILASKVLGYKVKRVPIWKHDYDEHILELEDTMWVLRWSLYDDIYKIIKNNIIPMDKVIQYLALEGYLVSY